MSISAVPALFHDLLDDAAMFPPAERSAADTLVRHQALVSGAAAEYVGPVVVAASRWREFCAAQRGVGARVDAVVVGSAEVPAEIPADVWIRGVECVATGSTVPDTGHRLALEPASLAVVEDLLAEIGEARIDGRPVVAKFRTGGVTADAFPSVDDLGYCILASFNAGVPFKLTAGLHHALRHTDAVTGFEHHGYLNVMLAVSRALEGGSQDVIAAALAEQDPDVVLAEIARWSPDDVIAIRSVFLSFGCCAVDEPLADARDLGLLAADAA